MAIDFRVSEHWVHRGVHIVEILVDGAMVGVMYPAGEKVVRIISAHIASTETGEGFAGEVIKDDGRTSFPPIPAVTVRFDPSPYYTRGIELSSSERTSEGARPRHTKV